MSNFLSIITGNFISKYLIIGNIKIKFEGLFYTFSHFKRSILRYIIIINIQYYYKMGIYTKGTIFGIKIYNFIDDDFANILFEEKYIEIMSNEQLREAYLFYTELNNKHDIRFQYYTECSSTYDDGIFFMWYPISLNFFSEKFDI